MKRFHFVILLGLVLGAMLRVGVVRIAHAGVVQGNGIEIDRVDILGATIFPADEIETTLEIGTGDLLERLKVLRTEENLQNLYVRHGYEEVSIRSRLVRKKNDQQGIETVLEFSVQEGRPVRIASIRLVSSHEGDARFQDLWRSWEPRLMAKLGITVGDIYNQEQLNEAKRRLQELLATDEYIGSKVDEYKKVAEFPASLKNSLPSGEGTGGPAADHRSSEEKWAASKWVALELRVDLGERVEFGFRGNEFFTLGHLDSLVAEQRLLGLGKDYVSIIQKKVEEDYRANGFAKVEIVPYTFENPGHFQRKVTYVIREGPRVRIESVDFDGNLIFSADELRNRFFLKGGALTQQMVYVEKEVQRSAELLIEWLKEKGYLSARLITINVTPGQKRKTQQPWSSVKLLIYLSEGDQTLVGKFTVEGATVFSPEEIEKFLQIKVNAPLNLFAFGDGLDVLKKAYKDRGYLSFQVRNEGTQNLVKYSDENRSAQIFLQLDEGLQYRLTRIEIEGLVYAQEKIVRRELRVTVGEVLKESDLLVSERRLRKLGIFSVVTIKTLDDPSVKDGKIVRISLKEADRGVFTYGPGFRNDLGIRAFSQLSYTNLWGDNHTASLNLSANRRFDSYQFIEGQAQASYFWPWFGGVPELNFRPTVAGGRTQYINFSTDAATLSTIWDKQLLVSPSVTGSLGATFEYINQFLVNNPQDLGQFFIGTVTPKVSVDFRDNPLSPTRGFFSTVWFDLAGGTSAVSDAKGNPGNPPNPPVGYYRFQTRNDYHIPLFSDIVWYFSFRMGYEQTFNPYQIVPLIKEFTIGGIGSLRGYAEQGIFNNAALTCGGVQTVNCGSLSYVNYRTEIDLPFSGALKFGVFLDAGNLLVNSFSFGGLNYGTGFGFHYQTPVGPVNFEVGFKVNPEPTETQPYIIHFSVGVI